MRRLAIALLAALTLQSSVLADAQAYRISEDWGGSVVAYIKKWNMLRNAGANVVIDGACISACTLVVGLMPRDRLCATRYAILGFHTGVNERTGEYDLFGSQFMFRMLPDELVALLADKGLTADSPHPDVVMLSREETLRFVRACD